MFPLLLCASIILNPTLSFNSEEIDNHRMPSWCDEKCYFGEREVTMENLKYWPSDCDSVCAYLVFNSKLDVPFSELKAIFNGLKVVDGGLRVEGTHLTNISFFPPNMRFINFFNGILIMNNSQLESIDELTKESMCSEAYVQISDNPKLNASSLCQSDCYRLRIDLKIVGNKRNCDCCGDVINSKNIKKYKGCDFIGGGMRLEDVDDRSELSALSDVNIITGDVEITRTNLTSLSFFKNLESIQSRAFDNDIRGRNMINIHDNYELRRLGWVYLYYLTNKLRYRFKMNLENLHPEFCITYEEMLVFLSDDVRFENIDAQYCKVSKKNHFAKLCVFESMSKLEKDCAFIFGNLLIDSGDKRHVDKLKTVTHVFGTITVQNTSLTNCDFFENLERVASLDDNLPVMQFLSNKNLTSLRIPYLRNFLAKVNNRVILEGNHPNVFPNLKDCMKFQSQAFTNVSVDGKPCKSIPKALPDGYGVDLDNIDYSEYSTFDWDYLEEPLYNVDVTNYYDSWKSKQEINAFTSLICFLINVFHLNILLQKELRGMSVFIVMIGISMCHLLLTSSFIFDYVINNEWLYSFNKCLEQRYFHRFTYMLNACLRPIVRRCASFLALHIALLRTLSFAFPMSSRVKRLSAQKTTVLIVIGMFLICVVWERTPQRCAKIEQIANQYACWRHYETYVGYEFINDEPCSNRFEYYNFRDGIAVLTTVILYSILTIVLLIQLQIARNRRKNLQTNTETAGKPESTSSLVIFMTISFFISEFIYGYFYFYGANLHGYFDEIWNLAVRMRDFLWMFVMINSNVHCIFCYHLSTHYRETVKRLVKKHSYITPMTRHLASS